uniref:flagellar basal body rod C-terminal domain-containing protein n=1 Tax=Escherichia coli TaxID=562 RepID=UPI0025730D41
PQRDENIKASGVFLGGRNVGGVGEMMSSTAMNRQFEAQIKMMKTAEDISDAGNRLLRGS